jgi:DNA-binding response OmpR family regulator
VQTNPRPGATRRLRIAIIEDEALVALEAELQLTEAGHHVVGTADTFEGAMSLLESARPDMALVDIRLAKGSSGLDVARAFDGEGVLCLFASGNCPVDGAPGAVGCLHKPYSARQLLHAIEVALAIRDGRAPGHVPTVLQLYR